MDLTGLNTRNHAHAELRGAHNVLVSKLDNHLSGRALTVFTRNVFGRPHSVWYLCPRCSGLRYLHVRVYLTKRCSFLRVRDEAATKKRGPGWYPPAPRTMSRASVCQCRGQGEWTTDIEPGQLTEVAKRVAADVCEAPEKSHVYWWTRAAWETAEEGSAAPRPYPVEMEPTTSR